MYPKLLSTSFLLFIFLNIGAQSITNITEVISAGGGESIGNNYSNFGVIGEVLVDRSVAGGSYNMSIGFLYASDRPPGVIEISSDTEIILFPNPATDYLNIQVKGLSVSRLEMYDLLGTKLVDLEFCGNIDVSTISRGMYILKFNDIDGNNIRSLKFFKR
jgi:hypothetical protein